MTKLKELQDYHEAMKLLEEKRSNEITASLFKSFYENSYNIEPKTKEKKLKKLRSLSLDVLEQMLRNYPSGGYLNFIETKGTDRAGNLYESEIKDEIDFKRRNYNTGA